MSTLKTNNIQHVDRSDPSIIINTDGGVSIAGTLTYEDVTSVDAVGIVTAREILNAQKQVHVGTGVSVKAGGINVTAGITTVQALQATTGTFSAAVSGTTGTFSGAVSGTTGTFTGDVDIADKIVHTGDTNTAIRFPSADTIRFETAGSERVNISSNGNITLGTASAAGNKLYFQSTSGAAQYIASGGTNNQDLLIGSSAGEFVRISSSGRFGVGTNNPASQVDIHCGSDNTALQITSTDAGAFMSAYDNTGASSFGHSGANLVLSCDPAGSVSSSAIVFQVDSNSEKMRIDSSGRLLLGTSSSRGNYGNNASGVDYKMQIEGTSATTSSLALVRNSNDANDGGIILGKTRATSVGGNTVVQAGDDLGTLSFVGSDGSTLQFGADIGAEVESGVGNDDMPTSLFFKTNAGSTSTTEKMRIDGHGRVMIGNTNAATMYQDGGDDLVVGNTSGSHGITIISQNNNVGRIMFSDTYTSGTGTYEGQILYSHASNTLNFYANYTAHTALPMTLGGANGDLTLHTGNLVIGTSGKGIDFSATSDGSGTDSSELLDDYEEGTWTPTQPTVGTTGTVAGHYTKIGDMVMAQMIAVIPDNSSGHDVVFDGLPYTAKNGTDGNYIQGGFLTYTNKGSYYSVLVTNNSDRLVVYNTSGGRETLTNWDNKSVRIGITYKIA